MLRQPTQNGRGEKAGHVPQRRGLATALLERAQRLALEIAEIGVRLGDQNLAEMKVSVDPFARLRRGLVRIAGKQREPASHPRVPREALDAVPEGIGHRVPAGLLSMPRNDKVGPS
jgi:hypothetical protein